MKRIINIKPSLATKVILGLLPFVILLIIYVWASDLRLSENPNDKLTPSLSTIGQAIDRMAFQPSKRSGEYLLWNDTLTSLQRLFLGVMLSALVGLFFGVLNGSIPMAMAQFSPLATILSLIPPMAILPILFIIFGLGEISKVVLIMIGITPFIIRDLQNRAMELPSEQLIKAQTLGANSWQVIIRVILPQVMPRLLEAVRLSLGTAWLFLIAAEAIASQEGLGYRIFLVRRYLSMDVILPYVAWITLLAFLTDWMLRRISLYFYPWFHPKKGRS